MPRTSKPDALSPIQHAILAAAARHPEHRPTRPETVKPPTYRSALHALRRRGLIADAQAAEGSRGRSAGPVLSPAGLARIAPPVPSAPEVKVAAQPEPAAVRSPRPSSKLAIIITLLSRPDGAGIDELVASTGWLPHTTRAALTGLRKRGYALAASRTTGSPTRYRVAADGSAATDTAAPTAAETATEEAAR